MEGGGGAEEGKQRGQSGQDRGARRVRWKCHEDNHEKTYATHILSPTNNTNRAENGDLGKQPAKNVKLVDLLIFLHNFLYIRIKIFHIMVL